MEKTMRFMSAEEFEQMSQGRKMKAPNILVNCSRCGGTTWNCDPSICNNCSMAERHPEEWKVYHMSFDEAVAYYKAKARTERNGVPHER